MTITTRESVPTRTGFIRFETLNSVYRFVWVRGERWGTLTCEKGTFEGKTMTAQTEDVRDLAWIGERMRALCSDGKVLTTTPILYVSRSTDF